MSDVRKFLARFLDTDGDGGGTKDAASDYSDVGAGLTEFKLAPAAGERFLIHDLHIHYDDTGLFDSGKFGNSITISNGVVVQVKNASGVIIDITDGVPCTTNADWLRYCHEVHHLNMGQGNEMLTAYFSFGKHGTSLRLDGDAGEYLAVILHDDFSGLAEMYFYAEGAIETETT